MLALILRPFTRVRRAMRRLAAFGLAPLALAAGVSGAGARGAPLADPTGDATDAALAKTARLDSVPPDQWDRDYALTEARFAQWLTIMHLLADRGLVHRDASMSFPGPDVAAGEIVFEYTGESKGKAADRFLKKGYAVRLVRQGGMSVPEFLQLNHAVLRALALAQGAPATNSSSVERANAEFIRPHSAEIDAVFGGMH